MPLFTKNGKTDDKDIDYVAFDNWDQTEPAAVDVPIDVLPENIVPLIANIQSIKIEFPTFSDGRGFTLARSIRDNGYTGNLRASGHLITEQFSQAIDCGFDEIQIDEQLAARQAANDWSYVERRTYRDKLRSSNPSGKFFPVPDGVWSETVTAVQHFSDNLFRFRITRPDGFRFRSGEFAMIGLPNAENPVFRAYSIASPAWDEELEFYSIKVPNGPLTQFLQRIKPGDQVLIKRKATGTLVNDVLLPGSRLWMLSTGTGIAPFASLIRDPETYEKFENLYLVHTARTHDELQCGYDITEKTRIDPLVGEHAAKQMIHYASTTRETSKQMGRITTLIENGKIFSDLGVSGLSPETDRIMICGSIQMIKDLKDICIKNGFTEGSHREAGTFAVERAFAG